jgi:hypothetical protein
MFVTACTGHKQLHIAVLMLLNAILFFRSEDSGPLRQKQMTEGNFFAPLINYISNLQISLK